MRVRVCPLHKRHSKLACCFPVSPSDAGIKELDSNILAHSTPLHSRSPDCRRLGPHLLGVPVGDAGHDAVVLLPPLHIPGRPRGAVSLHKVARKMSPTTIWGGAMSCKSCVARHHKSCMARTFHMSSFSIEPHGFGPAQTRNLLFSIAFHSAFFKKKLLT